MIIRHAEKPPDSGAPFGVDPGGHKDPHSLTVAGWTRAGGLAGLFVAPPPGLIRPDAVFAAVGDDGNSARCLQTVAPLAERLGLDVDTSYGKGQEVELAAVLAGRTGVTLVAWQHESISGLTHHLGTVIPEPPTDWPDDRYDVVLVFEGRADTWTLRQVPQLLLAGDVPEPI